MFISQKSQGAVSWLLNCFWSNDNHWILW